MACWIVVQVLTYGHPTVPAPFVEDPPFCTEFAPLLQISRARMCKLISGLFVHSSIYLYADPSLS